ncbi:MAG: BolA/IbaG family iron-sulfur metabolism protein [Legionellales bacterium]|nr:BolA/IbaG family iron-sulfur metabolism protein [Legionellales bacterium]
MMENDIRQLLTQTFPQAHIAIELEGGHCHITVVSDVFIDKTKLQRQQMINRLLGSMIAEGHLHALHLQTYTSQEWEALNG